MAAAWSPDGMRIVTFGCDGIGRLWDADTGELLGTFPTATSPMFARWSPSGSRFLIGCCPGVDVWDAATLQKVEAFPAEDPNTTGAWSPDGRAIAIGYASGDLRIYPAWQSLEELIAYAKAHCVLRELTPEERTRYGLRAM
jgi:WD40 repeat protein